MNSNPAIWVYTRLSTAILVIFLISSPLEGQLLNEKDTIHQEIITTG